MKLRIAHLYADLMNIYGDWGNISSLTYRSQQRGIDVSIEAIELGQTIKPEQFDLFFIGGGQDAGQELVAEDLRSKSEIMKSEVDSGAALLAICGGYQLLGYEYCTAEGKVLPGAGLLPVKTTAEGQRLMNNLVVAINPKLTIDKSESATLVGFENHSGRTQLLEGAVPLGRVLKGNGNNGRDDTEGVVYKAAVGKLRQT